MKEGVREIRKKGMIRERGEIVKKLWFIPVIFHLFFLSLGVIEVLMLVNQEREQHLRELFCSFPLI